MYSRAVFFHLQRKVSEAKQCEHFLCLLCVFVLHTHKHIHPTLHVIQIWVTQCTHSYWSSLLSHSCIHLWLTMPIKLILTEWGVVGICIESNCLFCFISLNDETPPWILIASNAHWLWQVFELERVHISSVINTALGCGPLSVQM